MFGAAGGCAVLMMVPALCPAWWGGSPREQRRHPTDVPKQLGMLHVLIHRVPFIQPGKKTREFGRATWPLSLFSFILPGGV